MTKVGRGDDGGREVGEGLGHGGVDGDGGAASRARIGDGTGLRLRLRVRLRGLRGQSLRMRLREGLEMRVGGHSPRASSNATCSGSCSNATTQQCKYVRVQVGNANEGASGRGSVQFTSCLLWARARAAPLSTPMSGIWLAAVLLLWARPGFGHGRSPLQRCS